MKNSIFKIISAVLFVIFTALCATSCLKNHECSVCSRKGTEVYYDASHDPEHLLCKECALTYWIPLDYEDIQDLRY